MIAGPNGAGKTTLVTRRIEQRIPVVNPDNIAQDLPRVNGGLDERGAGEIALRRRESMLREGASFAIETTLSGNSTLRFMAAAREAGHKISLVFVGVRSVEISGRRVADRVRRGGHAVPVTAILRRYPDALAKLPKALRLADRIFVLDNSGERRRSLLAYENGHARFLARDLPAWLTNALSGII